MSTVNPKSGYSSADYDHRTYDHRTYYHNSGKPSDNFYKHKSAHTADWYKHAE